MIVSRVLLSTALAVTASLTVSTLATAAPAFAAVASAEDTSAEVLPFPKDAWVVSSGPKGFVSAQYVDSGVTWRWTRHLDGATTVLPGTSVGSYKASPQSDVLAEPLADGGVTLHDLSAGTSVTLDAEPDSTFFGYAGSRALAKKPLMTGGTGLHVIGKQAGVQTADFVTGMAPDAVIGSVFIDGPDTALVRYKTTASGTQRTRVAVVDIASHAVVEEYDVPAYADGHIDVSSTHIAWVEHPDDSTARIAVTPRKTTDTVRFDPGWRYGVLRLTAGWVTYQRPGNNPRTPYQVAAPLKARSLTTGQTVTLLDNTVHVSAATPEGGVLTRGGTLDQGEGVYRIDSTDGATPPAVTRVASTGQSSKLELLDQSGATGTFALDRSGTPTGLAWVLNTQDARVNVEVTHTATKRTWTGRVYCCDRGADTFTLSWNTLAGAFDDYRPLSNGDYTWRLTGTLPNGLGPALDKTGTFKIARATAPHDFNDDGAPDLLLRSTWGSLQLSNVHSTEEATTLGTGGWNAYDRLLTPGNVGGTKYPDIVARDKTGVLWLHQGTGRSLAARTRIGGGWGVYDKLASGSDLTGDGRPDLVATDKYGTLWLYKGTGAASSPFAAPKRIGGGWGVYNRIVATGNIAGGAAGDLVARDKDGVLWLHLGKGDGTFAPRTRIGGGWGQFDDVVAIGDHNLDGRADLVAYKAYDATLTYYKGTGEWRAPFASGDRFTLYNSSFNTIF